MNLEFVPLLHRNHPSQTDFWNANVEEALKKPDTVLLTFNELDMSFEANLSPQRAAELYRTYLMPFACKARLGAPSVTNSQTPGQELDWLRAFSSACDDCVIDFIPVHVYGPVGDLEVSEKQVTGAHEAGCSAGGCRPVWVTEFGPPDNHGSTGERIGLMKAFIAWLNA